MEPQHSNHSNKKGKQTMPVDLSRDTKDTKQEPNLDVPETTVLLNAVHQVQTRRGRLGFNFTAAEKHDIFRLFKASLPCTAREKEKTMNILKVLMSRFKVCSDLANRSGGGWDDDNHRPIAPSEMDYMEMVRAKGNSAKFLLKSNFPWYRQMVTMIGGQAARGDFRANTLADAEPIELMLSLQMSIQVSEQGSSDDHNDGNNINDSGSSRPAWTHESDGAFPSHENSGSKRKSTDESSDLNTRGKRYKERNQKKKQEVERLADAGLVLASAMREETKRKLSREEEIDRCLDKFDELGLVKNVLQFCMTACKDDPMRRKWFLKNDRETILEWIEDNISPSNHAHRPPMPSNYAPSHPYAQPTSAAFNYSSFHHGP